MIGSVKSSVDKSSFYNIKAMSFWVESDGLSRETFISVIGDFSLHFSRWNSPISVIQQKVIMSPGFKRWKYWEAKDVKSKSESTSKNKMCLKKTEFWLQGSFHLSIKPWLGSKSISKRLSFFLNILIKFYYSQTYTVEIKCNKTSIVNT